MTNYPKHVAVIVDGNRRWAKAQNMDFFDAYKVAGKNLVKVACQASRTGIDTVTAFLFSTENWQRDQDEIESVFTAFSEILYQFTLTFKCNGIRVHTIGDTQALPTEVQKALEFSQCNTTQCQTMNLVLAFNYGGRWDISQAIHQLMASNPNDVKLKQHDIMNALSTAAFGDPDLLIRTGKQQRISNFMLWQLAYTELYFSDLMWPDFKPARFQDALEDYAQRERRKGS